MINNCSLQLWFLNTINPARFLVHCLRRCFIAHPEACRGFAVWFCCLEFPDPVVMPLRFSEGEWGPSSTASCPSRVFWAHRGKERCSQPWAKAAQPFFPQTGAGGGSWGFRKHPFGSKESLQFWGLGRDREEMAWRNLCKSGCPQNPKWQPQGWVGLG